MRHANIAFIPFLLLTAAAGQPARTGKVAQGPTVVAHTADVTRGRATLELQLTNADVVTITLQGGEIRINGETAGTYEPGGKLETEWRSFLDSAGSLNSGDVALAARKMPGGLTGVDAVALKSITTAVTTLKAVPAGTVVTAPTPPAPPAEPRVRFGRNRDNPDPTIEPAAPRSTFVGVGASVAGLFGAFVALASIAFGLVSFAPRQLNVISDTVQQSFVRSFFAGLFAQPLLLPALGVLIVALVLTIVGILVVPVAIIAFGLAVAAAVVGGYIAAARALGEVYLRRKMAQGILVSADPVFRSIVIGLGGLLMIWAPFALLGWIPGVGIALLWAAILFTWVMATAGLGATILSRAGLRGTFGRQVTPQLSGELSWSTVDEIAPSKRGEGSVP
jgi:hypothetical protein